ncbi:M20/M25/M40 family metallo-hydrolase [Aquiflexum gelatinilyticum]|uniref:M20/M25/M40 family metallo-hydrolase n=1 Tax=Aquiflexum gelatinilyticum TaxID=2961943 RepID=UPI002169FE03|nr:M20/M25/M40 family metallo-hydrolase [Aquiflexum gelatinilyticum]MCS4436003.1 M20/M25/M40 family metallo-hydrolase [Aquiflexum gelatinilyticum]
MKLNLTFFLVFSLIIGNHILAQTIQPKYQKEVQELARKPAIKKAFEYIIEIDPVTIQDMITLTEIPTPTFHEKEKGIVYADMLRKAGADSVWTDEVGNVIALRKGTKSDKTIMVDAHLDTVFPFGTDVKVKQRGDTLFAPGITDANRALAVVVALVKTMSSQNIRTESDIWFTGSVGEEGLGDLKGMKHLFREGGQPIASFIAIDGGGLEDIVNGGIGSLRYRVTFKGPGGHSYGAFGIGNPHNALAQAVASFVPKADEFTKEGLKTTYSISVLGGGTSVNSIPFESWMLVDMRSESQEKLKGINQIFLESMQEGLAKENKIIRRGEALTVDIEKVGDRPSGIASPESTLIQQTMAIADYLTGGKKPELSSSSTNSNVAFSKGIPAVTIGRGGIGYGAHSLGEYFINKDGHLAIQQALLLVLMQGGWK